MARPKPDPGMQVSLFPFMSILACLIGALVVMIVATSVAQTDQVEGRTEEEVARAQEFLELEKEVKQADAKLTELQTLIDEAQKAADELEETRKRNVLLMGNLNISSTDKELKANKQAELQQLLENMQADLRVWTAQKKDLNEQIAALQEELNKRKIDPNAKPPPVVVMPSGSGPPPGTKYFFVEANSGGLKVLRSFDEELAVTDIIRVSTNSIGVDEDLNKWLDAVANVPNSQIIALVRSNAHTSSAYIRNYAMSTEHPYQIPVSRLPIPGEGDADIKSFKEYLGELPPRETPNPPKGGGGGKKKPAAEGGAAKPAADAKKGGGDKPPAKP